MKRNKLTAKFWEVRVGANRVEIDNLQIFYGLAIRRNTTYVQKTQDAVWATFYHRLSTDISPQHDRCPSDEDT